MISDIPFVHTLIGIAITVSWKFLSFQENTGGRQISATGHFAGVLARLRIIDSITAKQVREVCFKYLYDRCPVVAAVGPLEALPDYLRTRASMYWLRL